MKISVLIPCYNEEAVIKTTYERVKATLQSMEHKYELLYVNDGSSDTTLDILSEISYQDEKVKILNFSRNFGHQAAVSAGINHVTGDLCLIIDADLQDPPELLPEMIKKMEEENASVVYGVRKERKGETRFKKATASIFYKFINKLSDIELPLDAGDFRLIDRSVIESFKQLPERHKYVRGLIAWLGFKQVPFYYVREKRFAGETHYPLFKMISFALRGLLYFSNKPLRLATNIGFACILVGLGLLVFIVASLILQPEKIVSGWPSILTTVVFFGGVQLLTIGILGEYLGNMFEEVKQRPHYIIKNKINF